MPPGPLLDPSRFHSERPDDLRQARPWHRMAYIVDLLPRTLGGLAAELVLPPRPRVLDYGCAEIPYRRFFGADAEVVGADLPGNPEASIELRPDGSLPVEDSSFDAVLSTQVLEHVADPALYLAECHRILRPGGQLLLSTHGLMVYHPDPVDLWRWTGAGLERAVTDAGFEVTRLEGVMGLGATGLQLLQESLYYRLPRWPRTLLALCLQTLIRIADRLETPESRRLNALVLAVVARRP